MKRSLGTEEEVLAHGDTVGQALQDMERRYSNFKELLLEENGGLKPFVLIFLNDENIKYPKGLDTITKEGDILFVATAMAGG